MLFPNAAAALYAPSSLLHCFTNGRFDTIKYIQMRRAEPGAVFKETAEMLRSMSISRVKGYPQNSTPTKYGYVETSASAIRPLKTIVAGGYGIPRFGAGLSPAWCKVVALRRDVVEA